MRILFILLLVISSQIFLISCKDDVDNIVPIDYSYFPIDTGRWITYDVEEITIDKPSELYDTVRYQLKEVIQS